MSDVSLSASVRQSLLSLQNTSNLIEQTQNRLSTGLRVSSAIDDPVAFFSSKTLSDRASDLLEKKDGIDQGISTVTAALDGVEAVESLIKQMKGVVNSMKSATDTQLGELISQFNDLRNQVDNLTTDATYQGTNLINGTGQTLTLEFSDLSGSLLEIESVDLRAGSAGLGVNSVTESFTDVVGYSATTAGTSVSADETLTLTYQGTNTITLTTADGAQTFNYGTSSVTFNVAASQSLVLSQGAVLTVSVVSASTVTSQITGAAFVNLGAASVSGSTATVTVTEPTQFIRVGDTTSLNAAIGDLDDALSTLRTQAQTLGSNVALLNTRLDFTQNYTNTLEEGANKLVLADINEEGANLLALQTRQQLGIQSLSLAAQAESSILQLFG